MSVYQPQLQLQPPFFYAPWPGHPYVVVEAVPQIMVAFPGAHPLPPVRTLPGKRLVRLPHDLPTHHALAKLGVKLLPPILHDGYDWNSDTPFDSQKVTAGFLTINPRAYVLNQMGTGKTRAVLFALDWLIAQGVIQRALVAAPLSTLWRVWELELYMRFPNLHGIVLHGSKKRRLKRLADDRWNVAVINHDGLRVMYDLLEKGGAGIGALIVDELAVFRNRSSLQWRAGRRCADQLPFVWGLTGSPTPNSPTDAWAQVRMVDPPQCNMTFARFEDEVTYQASSFRRAPRPAAAKHVFELMQPSIRFARSQVIELPPVTEVMRDAPMSPLQVRVYQKLKNHLIVLHSTGAVSAANAGVLLFKLAQVAGGCVYDDKGDTIVIGAPERYNLVREIVEQSSNKVIIFAAFRHFLDQIFKVLTTPVSSTGFAGTNCAIVHGGISPAARNTIFADFQNMADPRVLIAHPRTMAHGLTLTAADTIVWYGPYPSAEIVEQATDRIARPGQTSDKILIVKISGSAVEDRIYNMNSQRRDFATECLDLFQNNLDGI